MSKKKIRNQDSLRTRMKPYICTAQLFSKSGRCLAHLCRERTRLHGLTNTQDVSIYLALTAATRSTQHTTPNLRFTATLRNNGCFCLFFQNPQLLLFSTPPARNKLTLC